MSLRLEPEDPVLDAAHACVLAVGVRRTTFSDVARRAGVSRMTLYRRYPDLEALLSALMTYEFGALVAAAASPGRGSRSTPPPAGCRSRCSSAATSPTGPAAGARSSCTAACATSSTA